MISSEQQLNDEELIEQGGEEEQSFGYIKLFDHFHLTKEERQNPDKVAKIEYIWKGLLLLAKEVDTTPMQKLARIELGLTQELYVSKLDRVYQFIRLSMQKIDIDAELSTL